VTYQTATRRVFWAAAGLALFLVAVKAYYLGVPPALTTDALVDYLRSLAAISYDDVLFASIAWGVARAALEVAERRTERQRVALRAALSVGFIAFGAVAAVYAVASVVVFGIFGGFLTYPLLSLVGDVRMLSSSVAANLTPPVVTSLIALPVAYLAAVEIVVYALSSLSAAWQPRLRAAVALVPVIGWLAFGVYTFSADWSTRQDRRIAENSHWVLLSSWWEVMTGEGAARLVDQFPADYLNDFNPIGVRPVGGRRQSPNVIVIVLESVAARWTSLNGGPYDSTPSLKRESANALVADNFYAHIGRSSNSLAAILLSTYPKLGFRDVTEEYPRLPGTSLAALMRDRGYRTAFVTPSDLTWAEWNPFLEARGFGELTDLHRMKCSNPVSSWGLEDRCMVDSVIDFVSQPSHRPFFVMGWTTQTHHPYEPTPGVPVVPMRREPVPDQWELDRYLTVLHETDRHLGRLFDALRQLKLDQDTVVIVAGDHGQAFGYPHDTYIQGRTMYEEDVHVPLLVWYPRLYKTAARTRTVGSHVDLAPTIADLVGVAPAPDWQGRSLFDPSRPERAYFYVAEDEFTLGLREGAWKYIINLRDGNDELYNLDRDPDEQNNRVSEEPERAVEMRRRLAAWTEANRRQYEHASEPLRTAER
jgi:arylsulfatase A-like enzyme